MSDVTKTSEPVDEVTLTVSREDLRLIRSALEEFMASFSHEQGGLVDRIKSLLVRLPDGPAKRDGPSAFRRLTL